MPKELDAAALAVESYSEPTLDIDAGFNREDIFMLRPVDESGEVPAFTVPSLTVSEAGVYDAITSLARSAGLSVSIEGGITGSDRFGAVTVANLRGNLKQVLDDLSESLGFFYSIRRNTLYIYPEQQFVIELPPALDDDYAATLTNTLAFLGAKDTYIDRLSRSLVLTANKKGLQKIEGYLKKIRDTRSLIVYDFNIFQVDLRDNANTGIRWNALDWSSRPVTVSEGGSGAVSAIRGKTANLTSTATGMGMILSGSRFTVDMLIDFLETQGTVKALSRPRLAVMSGSKGSLSVGQISTILSKVGTNFSTSLNQTTTETRDIRTGVNFALYGDYSDNTVYTRLALDISELIREKAVRALGTDFTLPTTATRELNSIVRQRPGDMFVLGGITIDRVNEEGSRGITGTGTSKELVRSELVITLKTKVINFKSSESAASVKQPAAEVVGKVQQLQMPDQIVGKTAPFRQAGNSAFTDYLARHMSHTPLATLRNTALCVTTSCKE
jgi:hypothetical protein